MPRYRRAAKWSCDFLCDFARTVWSHLVPLRRFEEDPYCIEKIPHFRDLSVPKMNKSYEAFRGSSPLFSTRKKPEKIGLFHFSCAFSCAFVY